MVSFLVACFNEEKNILANVEEIKKACNKCQINSYEIIFINDGSTDNSLNVVREYNNHNKLINIKILNNKINFGYGGSVKKGIDSSQKEYVIWAPGNLRKDIELVVFATMLSIIYPGKGQRDDFCYAISCLLKKWGQWSEERINKFI